MQRIHFIAIGGRAMHNLAIALQKNGFIVSGSDDEIFDPSYTNLKNNNLLPDSIGWFPEKITKDIDTIILGRHAKNDNPELLRAQELGIRIYSYPEFIYTMSQHKQRVVIAGSHGKNTIASIVMHVLSYYEYDFDYLVSATVPGHEGTIKLSETNKIIIIEGDEHVTSTIDDRSKFEHYKPHIALLSGIAWDHVNTFSTFDMYVEQFKKYVNSIEHNGKLIYNNDDSIVQQVINETPEHVQRAPYTMHPYEVFDNRSFLKISGGRLPVFLFGEHNMQNIAGAIKVCQFLKISEEKFYRAIKTFKGTSKHLQLIGKSKTVNIYLDFAHSPVKLNYTIKAIREQFPNRELIVCLELYATSSLYDSFLNQYNGSMNLADEKIVYINPETLRKKGFDNISEERIKEAFGSTKINVFTSVEDVKSELYMIRWNKKILLLMSSGNFSGLNYTEFAEKIIGLSKDTE
ncbi:MAG TPA: Mur ligase family protein [Bacteroidales bacterium]|nr:Mur ligase family protein [Bacteroidales bacterium]